MTNTTNLSKNQFVTTITIHIGDLLVFDDSCNERTIYTEERGRNPMRQERIQVGNFPRYGIQGSRVSKGVVSWGRVSKGVEYLGGRVYSKKGHGTKDTLLPRRNIVPEIPYPVKEHGTKDTLLPGKDMGPGTMKEPGTRDTLPLPCEQNDWQMPVKTLPSRNFIGGRLTQLFNIMNHNLKWINYMSLSLFSLKLCSHWCQWPFWPSKLPLPCEHLNLLLWYPFLTSQFNWQKPAVVNYCHTNKSWRYNYSATFANRLLCSHKNFSTRNFIIKKLIGMISRRSSNLVVMVGRKNNLNRRWATWKHQWNYIKFVLLFKTKPKYFYWNHHIQSMRYIYWMT